MSRFGKDHPRARGATMPVLRPSRNGETIESPGSLLHQPSRTIHRMITCYKDAIDAQLSAMAES